MKKVSEAVLDLINNPKIQVVETDTSTINVEDKEKPFPFIEIEGTPDGYTLIHF